MRNKQSLTVAIRRARARRELPTPHLCRQIRERAGLSQSDVARALGVTREAVAYWELGKRIPRPDRALAYGALLERLAAEVNPHVA